MNIFNVILIIGLLVSCAQVNQESREFYMKGSPVRHGLIPRTSNGKSVPVKLNSISVKRGEIVYKENCYACHGDKGTGNGPSASGQKPRPANLVKVVKEVPNFKIFMMVSRWQGKMPGWKSYLSERQINDVEQYIRSLALKN